MSVCIGLFTDAACYAMRCLPEFRLSIVRMAVLTVTNRPSEDQIAAPGAGVFLQPMGRVRRRLSRRLGRYVEYNVYVSSFGYSFINSVRSWQPSRLPGAGG